MLLNWESPVTTAHRAKLAYIYVRQSTAGQVRQHQESTELQYRLVKMLAFSVPPGYRRSRPPARPKLDPFTGMIDGILAAGWRGLALFAPSRAADHGPALLAGYDRPAVQARIHCPARRDTGNASPSDEGDGRAGHRHRSQPVWWAA